MRYSNITDGIFIDRPNRFLAHVETEDGIELVHVKNTGRCGELLKPGSRVYLEKSSDPKRKTVYDLISVIKSTTGVLFNIDSQAPNKVVKEYLTEEGDFDLIRPEYVYESSRIDFYMEKGDRRFLMEVKGCTLERDGIGYFPDAPTERGRKHILELIKAKERGYEACICFVIQMEGVDKVIGNRETDPAFADALESAERKGVKILSLRTRVTKDSISYIAPEGSGSVLL